VPPRYPGRHQFLGWWQQTSPGSHFTRSTVCSRLDGESGRISITGRTLIRTDATGRSERPLESDVGHAFRSKVGGRDLLVEAEHVLRSYPALLVESRRNVPA
jgi:hypothetical protein